MLNLSISLCEEGEFVKAYDYLRKGFAADLREHEDEVPLVNKFQLQYLYLLQKYFTRNKISNKNVERKFTQYRKATQDTNIQV